MVTLNELDTSKKYKRTRQTIGAFYLLISICLLAYVIYVFGFSERGPRTSTYILAAVAISTFIAEVYMLAKFGLEGVYQVG